MGNRALTGRRGRATADAGERGRAGVGPVDGNDGGGHAGRAGGGCAGGFALAFKADGLWVGTAIDGVDGAGGTLGGDRGGGDPLPDGLEGSRHYTLAGRLSLRPIVEVGLRHDGGDAETGAGMDLGTGLVVSDSSTALVVDVRV